MAWLEILVLAVVQGIGEFLPISSSGHVVVGMALFKRFGHDIPEKLTVNIVLHVGTLLAILIFYRDRILQILSKDRRVIGLLIVGSVPAAVAGLILKRHFEPVLEEPLTAGVMFLVTGALLLWTARRHPGQTTCRELSYGKALWIGIFQAFAILPGLSRSGATIVAGLGSGLKRDEAAAFSFLLAIPAIGGAGLLDLKSLVVRSAGTAQQVPAAALALGAAVAFLVGLAALWWLIRWLDEGRLYLFALWVIPLGLAVLGWQLAS